MTTVAAAHWEITNSANDVVLAWTTRRWCLAAIRRRVTASPVIATSARRARAVASRSTGVARYIVVAPGPIPVTSSVGVMAASQIATRASTRAPTMANMAPMTHAAATIADGRLADLAINGSASHAHSRAHRPRAAAPVTERRRVLADATSAASTVPSSRGSPGVVVSRNAFGCCDWPAPSCRVRRCTGTNADGHNSTSVAGPAAGAEGKSRSETIVPIRRAVPPVCSVIGWTLTMRVPEGPGATNTAAGPPTRARSHARSDGRPAQASGVFWAE